MGIIKLCYVLWHINFMLFCHKSTQMIIIYGHEHWIYNQMNMHFRKLLNFQFQAMEMKIYCGKKGPSTGAVFKSH